MGNYLKYSAGYFPPPLTGTEKGSIAYITIKDRLPIIVSNVIDHLCREKKTISEAFGEYASEDIKEVIGRLLQLKNEVQTNKPLKKFIVNPCVLNNEYEDNSIWNYAMRLYKQTTNEDLKWFEISWQFVECYFYKRIHECFILSNSLKTYDPFKDQKISSLRNAFETVEYLSEYLMRDVLLSSYSSQDEKKNIIFKLIEFSLWGNMYDLSVPCESTREESYLKLEEMRKNIIANDFEEFWRFLIELPKNGRRIAFVLDNAGAELFSDLCLAAALVEFSYVDSVCFYTKTRPWFISDTTIVDFKWTLDYLSANQGAPYELSELFKGYLKKGLWDIKERRFWTTPLVYSEMKKVDADLYRELESFVLIVFKGDLNYQKLVGDMKWPNNTSFSMALRGFMPSSMLLLRTIKGAPVVGLDEASPRVRNIKGKEKWNTSGEIGLIQFISYNVGLSSKRLFLLVLSTIFFLLLARYLI